MLPNTFQDAAGRRWSLCLTPWVAEQVYRRTEIELAWVFTDCSRRARLLFADPEGLAMTLWALCERQAVHYQITEAEFLAGLDRAALDAGSMALLGAGLQLCGETERGDLLSRLPQVFEILREVHEEGGHHGS